MQGIKPEISSDDSPNSAQAIPPRNLCGDFLQVFHLGNPPVNFFYGFLLDFWRYIQKVHLSQTSEVPSEDSYMIFCWEFLQELLMFPPKTIPGVSPGISSDDFSTNSFKGVFEKTLAGDSSRSSNNCFYEFFYKFQL